MSGMLKSLNATVIGTIVAAHSVWEDRKKVPLLLPQPATQWHQPQKASGFTGYQPIPDLFKTVNAVKLNPTDMTEYWLPREPPVVRFRATFPDHGSCRSEPRLAWLRAT
jgi:hypothetical protein